MQDCIGGSARAALCSRSIPEDPSISNNNSRTHTEQHGASMPNRDSNNNDREWHVEARSQGWPTSDDSVRPADGNFTGSGGWWKTSEEEEWGKKNTRGNNKGSTALNTSIGPSPSEISTVHPSTSVWAQSTITDTSTWSGLLLPDGLRPPSSSSTWKGVYDPVAEYSKMSEEERAILQYNKVDLDEEGWLVCRVCEKKTHIIFSVMLPHLQSKKHKQNLIYYKEAPTLASNTSTGWSQASGSLLDEFVEEKEDGSYHCKLCDKNPNSEWSLECHLKGQKHKSAVERETWRREVVSNGIGILRPEDSRPDDDTLSNYDSAMSTSSMAPLPPPPSPLHRSQNKPSSSSQEDLRPLYGGNGYPLPPGYRWWLRQRSLVSNRRN